MSALTETFLTGYNRDTAAAYKDRYEAGLQAVADAAKADVGTPPDPDITEPQLVDA